MSDTISLAADLMPEWPAFLDALSLRRPDQGTACSAWTTRDVVAHQAGNAEELERILRAHLDGGPVPATRSFEEREGPLRVLGDGDLHRALVERMDRLARTVEAALDDPDSDVPWTGRTMKVAWFGEHMREELALHRWDLVGDDPTSARLLGPRWVTEHSVVAVGRPLLARGQGRLGAPVAPVRLRVAGEDDVLVAGGPDGARIELVAPEGDAELETDAAARVLLLWGRQPCDGRRIVSGAGPQRLGELRTLLSGY